MPLDGWDHIELWVGNAKQAAYYYEHAFGFRRTAYAGPETGVRDRASYVLEQGEIRLVFTSGLRRDSPISEFACLHGDGVKDISLRVPDATNAYREAVQRGARGVAEPRWVEDEFGKVELSSIATYGDVVHTFVNRAGYEGAYLPGYVAQESTNGSDQGVGLQHVGGAVAKPGLEPRVGDRPEPEGVRVEVGRLGGVPHVELDVVDAVQRHEVGVCGGRRRLRRGDLGHVSSFSRGWCL